MIGHETTSVHNSGMASDSGQNTGTTSGHNSGMIALSRGPSGRAYLGLVQVTGYSSGYTIQNQQEEL